jgi:redox-regulated HSP33 family molecular chaperone
MAANIFTRDMSVKLTTRCGRFRLVAASTRNVLVETMQRHHLLSPAGEGGAIPETLAMYLTSTRTALPQLANVITLANLWAALLNSEERVRVEFHGTHVTPTGESLSLGETRAFLQPERSQLGASRGALRVQRVLYGHREPFVSTTVAPGGSPDDVCLATQAMYHCGQSDGVPTAVFLAAAFDPQTRMPAYSAGLLVQPIAPSESRTTEQREVIAALQSNFGALMRSVGDDGDGPATANADGAAAAGIDGLPFEASMADIEHCQLALDRRLRSGWAIHDLLALGSGDWDGAMAATTAARCYGGPASRRLLRPEGAQLKEFDTAAPYRGWFGDAAETGTEAHGQPPSGRWLGADPDSHAVTALRLDPGTLVRTPIDFFCRCSKDSIKKALLALGQGGLEARRLRDPDMAFPCSHCGKRWQLEPPDWDALIGSFNAGA